MLLRVVCRTESNLNFASRQSDTRSCVRVTFWVTVRSSKHSEPSRWNPHFHTQKRYDGKEIIFGVAVAMANEKQSRSGSAAKKATRKNSDSINRENRTTDAPVSTAQATVATARNAVIEGNATIDMDEVRRRAFELYEARGRREGYEAEDWFRAEQELRNGKKSA
jgi:hypothetical protein